MNQIQDKIKMKGVIAEKISSSIFLVKLENKISIACHVSGKIRQNNINILPGDRVDVEISIYDLSRGRIIYRYIK